MQPRAMLVRQMQPGDAEAVAGIYNEGIADRTATFETRSRTASEVAAWGTDHPAVVVEDGGDVVAWATVSGYHPGREVHRGVGDFTVYVARAARGRGAGRAALTALVDAARAAGYWKLIGRVFPENAASLALCRSLGFREVGTYLQHGRLDGRWRDCVVVERLLDGDDLGPIPGGSLSGGSLSGGLLAGLADQARLIEDVAAVVELGTPVPDVPDWTVGEVLRHVGTVHRLITDWLRAGRRPRVPRRPDSGADLRAWYAEGWPALVDELTSRPPEAPAATWNPADTTAGFWRRRMFHETAIHALDVVGAAGAVPAGGPAAPWTLDPALALDGIDEVLRLWLGTRLGADVGGDGSVVRVTAGGRAWTVGLHRFIAEVHEGVEVAGQPVPADAVVTGSPLAVYGWLWGRRTSADVVATGDVGTVALLRAVLTRAMR